MTKLPQQYRKYFWDCDFKEIKLEKYQFFITERLLSFGNEEVIRWLLPKINKADLAKVLKKSRNLDKKTRNYWQVVQND